MENNIKIEIDSRLENVSIVRVAITAMLSSMQVTIDEIMDVKTAVSEAVTNSIEHGYYNSQGIVIIEAKTKSVDNMDYIMIKVSDNGVGIEDIEMATTPTYTTKPEMEHAGMGFTIMETFMDEIVIDSHLGEGTSITLTKKINSKKSKNYV